MGSSWSCIKAADEPPVDSTPNSQDETDLIAESDRQADGTNGEVIPVLPLHPIKPSRDAEAEAVVPLTASDPSASQPTPARISSEEATPTPAALMPTPAPTPIGSKSQKLLDKIRAMHCLQHEATSMLTLVSDFTNALNTFKTNSSDMCDCGEEIEAAMQLLSEMSVTIKRMGKKINKPTGQLGNQLGALRIKSEIVSRRSNQLAPL